MISTRPDEVGLFAQAVTMLTQAATRRQAKGTALDFADFLTHVLAATAANVGGPDQLLAGRHGSEEAGHLDQLLRATMGCDASDWLRFRTAPVAVPLNVAQLIEDDLTHPGLMGLDEALESLGRRYESATGDADLDAWDSDIETVTAHYTAEYRLYAQRFTTAARASTEQHPGLTVRVEVYADPDPTSAWWTPPAITNPTTDDGDPLARWIWQAAHDATPLPNVNIWLGRFTNTTPTPS